jgi:hypothetical protein
VATRRGRQQGADVRGAGPETVAQTHGVADESPRILIKRHSQEETYRREARPFYLPSVTMLFTLLPRTHAARRGAREPSPPRAIRAG